MSRIASDLRRATRDVRLFLLGAFLLGTGQQVFVVVRNPYLVALGWRLSDVPAVQAVGALAGVGAGLVAIVGAGAASPRVFLLACALLQSVGFFVQSATPAHSSILAGATLAGFAIQLNTALAAPFLKAATRDGERTAIFSANQLVLAPLAGVAAAGLVRASASVLNDGIVGQRAALVVGAGVTATALLAFSGIAQPRIAASRLAFPRAPHRVLACCAIYALLGLAGGITVPFLQLYFTTTFGIAPQDVALVYGGTMVVGVAGFVIAPILARRFGLWQTFVATQLLALPLFAQLASARSVTFAACAFVARHTLLTMGMPLFHNVAQEVVAEGDGAAVSGGGVLVMSVTWAVGSSFASPLIRAGGGRFDLALRVTGALYLATGVLSALVLPRLWRSRAVLVSISVPDRAKRS